MAPPATPNSTTPTSAKTTPTPGAATAAPNGERLISPAEFLAHLYKDVPDGWIEITCLAPEKAKVNRITVTDPEGGQHHPKTVVFWRSAPLSQIDPNMPRLHDMNERGYGIYAAPIVRCQRKEGEWRTKTDGTRYWCAYPRGVEADASYIVAFYTEADDKDFGGDHAEARRRIESQHPSILVDSGAGYHGYWLLNELLEITEANRADVKRTLQGIAKAADVPPEVADLARIMRLPGFINTKPGRNRALCTVVYANDLRYRFSELFTTYAPLITIPKRHNTSSIFTSDSDQENEVAEALSHIPADTIDYKNGWIPILAALNTAFGKTTAVQIAEKWSDWCSKPGEIAAKMDTFDHYSGAPSTLGTIFHMAKQFGYVRPIKPTPAVHVVKRATTPTTETSPYFHADGAPSTWLKAIFKAFPGKKSVPKLFRLYNAALKAGLIDAHDFTITQLMVARIKLNFAITDSSLERAMNDTEGLFSNLIIVTETMPKNEIKSRRGRPERHYALMPLNEIEEALPRWAEKRIEEARHQERGTTPNLTQQMIDALDGDARAAAQEVAAELPPMSEMVRTSAWLARKNLGETLRALKDLRSVSLPNDCEDVRAALFAAENDPNEGISNIDIMREYGISRGSVPVLAKRGGLQAEVQSVACPITSAATFEQEVYQARKKFRGFPRTIVENKPTGEVVEHRYDATDADANRFVIEAAQRAGSTIQVKLQTANKYRPADPQQAQIAAEPKAPQSRSVSFHEPSEIRPYYGVGYNPSVVRHWLKTHLRRLKWRELPGSRFVSPDGEIFDVSEQDLLRFAELSLGAVITPLVKELA